MSVNQNLRSKLASMWERTFESIDIRPSELMTIEEGQRKLKLKKHSKYGRCENWKRSTHIFPVLINGKVLISLDVFADEASMRIRHLHPDRVCGHATCEIVQGRDRWCGKHRRSRKLRFAVDIVKAALTFIFTHELLFIGFAYGASFKWLSTYLSLLCMLPMVHPKVTPFYVWLSTNETRASRIVYLISSWFTILSYDCSSKLITVSLVRSTARTQLP